VDDGCFQDKKCCIFALREFVRNNLSILVIIFSLVKTSYSRNNGLFKNNSTKSKGNRIAKMGKLFLANSLNTEGSCFDV
jgi:hypothetical protein